MSTRTKHWRIRVITGLLAVSGLVVAQPAVEAKKKKPTVYRFFDGTANDGNATAWVAWVDKPRGNDPIYGLAGSVDLFSNDAVAARLSGKLRGATAAGKLLNGKGKRVGSFEGRPSGTTLTGSFTVPREGESNWTVTEVTKDVNAMTALDGFYSIGVDNREAARLEVDLDGEKGTLAIEGFFDDGTRARKVLNLTGRWIVDTDGSLWMLTDKVQITVPAGVQVPKLTKVFQPAKNGKLPSVLKLGYTLNGDGTVDVLNPFDTTEVLGTLSPN